MRKASRGESYPLLADGAFPSYKMLDSDSGKLQVVFFWVYNPETLRVEDGWVRNPETFNLKVVGFGYLQVGGCWVGSPSCRRLLDPGTFKLKICRVQHEVAEYFSPLITPLPPTATATTITATTMAHRKNHHAK